MNDQILIELLCIGYIALYIVLNTALFPSSLWLATLSCCLSVKSLYLLKTSLRQIGKDMDRWMAKANMALILGHLVFGRLIDAIAFAILAEILLLNIQHQLLKSSYFRPLWFFLFSFPEVMPFSWLLLRACNIALPALLADPLEAASKSETGNTPVPRDI